MNSSLTVSVYCALCIDFWFVITFHTSALEPLDLPFSEEPKSAMGQYLNHILYILYLVQINHCGPISVLA